MNTHPIPRVSVKRRRRPTDEMTSAGLRYTVPFSLPQGFTLVELLVVIAVIMILSGLVLSAVSRGRQLARRIECLSLQKQWAMAFLQYPEDHEDYIPREGTATNGSVRIHTWGEVLGRALPGAPSQSSSDEAWFNALPGRYLTGYQPAASYAQKAARTSFYDRGSYFHCPSAILPSEASQPNWLFPYFSMAMNSQLISAINAPCVRLSQFYDPSRTVVFLDNRLEKEKKVHPKQLDFDLGQPASWANRFSGRRHGKGGVLSFADGHVAWFEGSRVVEQSGPLAGSAPLVGPSIVWETRY